MALASISALASRTVDLSLHSPNDLLPSRGEILDASIDCMMILDDVGRLLWINPNGLRALEVGDPHTLLGKVWQDLWPAAARTEVAAAVRKAAGGAIGRFTVHCPTLMGTPRWWDVVVSRVAGTARTPPRLLAISRDITAHDAAVRRLRWTAAHDNLTGLANRTQFHERLERMIAHAGQQPFAVVLLDVDRFKQVNDQIGHVGGDALLYAIAGRLKGSCGPRDLAARLGGDEFALLLGSGAGKPPVVEAVASILARLREPFRHDDKFVDSGASAGIASFPGDGQTAAELLRNADAALHASKLAGRGGAVHFDHEMRESLSAHSEMLDLARSALAEDLIRPYYQPKYDLRTGQVRGFEALLRWRKPRGPLQYPESIRGAFDDPTVGPAISDKMITAVLADMQSWQRRGLAYPISINAATSDFREGDFADNLLAKLDARRLPTSMLEIEVVESVFLGRTAAVAEHSLRKLSAAGVRIALDDFGTGHASLSHLRDFPVDVIKIDQRFIRDLASDPDDRAIVRAMVVLGSSLSIQVVAEGIEHSAQADFLRSVGCHLGQGFLFAQAMAARRVPAFCRSSKRDAASPCPSSATSERT